MTHWLLAVASCSPAIVLILLGRARQASERHVSRTLSRWVRLCLRSAVDLRVVPGRRARTKHNTEPHMHILFVYMQVPRALGGREFPPSVRATPHNGIKLEIALESCFMIFCVCRAVNINAHAKWAVWDEFRHAMRPPSAFAHPQKRCVTRCSECTPAPAGDGGQRPSCVLWVRF